MSTSATPTRCIARRAFAAEYRDATYRFTEEDDDRAPRYQLLPTGQRANRLFIVGPLIEVTTSDDHSRGRVADPSGTVRILVDEEETPSIHKRIQTIELPEYVSVAGKTRRYEAEGTTFTNLRVEQLTVTSEQTQRRWILDTARQTAKRLEQFDAGTNPYAQLVQEQYDVDPTRYRDAALEVIADVVDKSETDRETNP